MEFDMVWSDSRLELWSFHDQELHMWEQLSAWQPEVRRRMYSRNARSWGYVKLSISLWFVFCLWSLSFLLLCRSTLHIQRVNKRPSTHEDRQSLQGPIMQSIRISGIRVPCQEDPKTNQDEQGNASSHSRSWPNWQCHLGFMPIFRECPANSNVLMAHMITHHTHNDHSPNSNNDNNDTRIYK